MRGAAAPQPTHDDIQRDIGRLEGKQDAMGQRLDRLEQMISEGFTEIRREIGELKTAENRRSGAFALGQWLAGLIGAGAALQEPHFWK